MLKQTLTVVIIGLTLLVSSATASVKVETGVDKTALVYKSCEDKSKNGWGSGVYVSPNKLYTAYHVVENIEGCEVLVDGVPSKVRYYSKGRDIAVLTHDKDTSNLTVRDPVLGEKIMCIGYSSQFFRTKPLMSVTYGSVTTVGLPKGLVRIDNNINSGHSGGGCFAESDGALLGVVVSAHQHFDDTPIAGYAYLRPIL